LFFLFAILRLRRESLNFIFKGAKMYFDKNELDAVRDSVKDNPGITIDQISKEIGLTEWTVFRYLNDLIKYGEVVKRYGKYFSN